MEERLGWGLGWHGLRSQAGRCKHQHQQHNLHAQRRRARSASAAHQRRRRSTVPWRWPLLPRRSRPLRPARGYHVRRWRCSDCCRAVLQEPRQDASRCRTADPRLTPHLHRRLGRHAALGSPQRVGRRPLPSPRQQQPARRLGQRGHACGASEPACQAGAAVPTAGSLQQRSRVLAGPGPGAPSASSAAGAAARPYIQRQPPSCSTYT